MIGCTLLLAGLMLIGVGGIMMVAPDVLHAKNGVILGSDPNLLSEIRAPGGFLLSAGGLIVASVILRRMQCHALAFTALIYGSFGIARLYAMNVDGVPVQSLVFVTGLEIGVGVIATILAYLEFNRTQLANSIVQT
ncbi:MAG: DUF4345 domain-containing protein [Sneathiellales bacterium]|nr:DUF4345 domain-containing protein [Sneathiellales bacterium]